MSADVLRRAASLMRERAEAATRTEMPWDVDEISAVWTQENDGQPVHICSRATDEDATHIASWHPAVALAVADLLESAASDLDSRQRCVDALMAGIGGEGSVRIDPEQLAPEALAVARAYLGETA